MFTKTKKIQEKNNDLKNNHYFSIPKKIQENINEKWFALYNWIWEQDVKQSIERDFLKLLNKLWTIWAVVLILPTIILLWNKNPLAYPVFFWLLWIINIFFLIYLLIIAIKRSSILRKNAYILITDKAVSINWKIKYIKENKIFSNKNLQQISELFEEELFKESKIKKSKQWFRKQVIDKITSWYWKILNSVSRTSRNNWWWVILLLALYTVYVVSVWLIYFIWIFFIWIFWNLLSYINKQILITTGHEITTINDYFEKIEKNSNNLVKEKNDLTTLLNQASNNNWKDSLLIKINNWIKKINKNASNAVDSSLNLKNVINKSKYKEMFNFSIYNSWIKKQIYIPLSEILKLLEKNLNSLKLNLENIEKEILKTTDESFKWPLVVSKTRTEVQIKNLEKHILWIKHYIDKLK